MATDLYSRAADCEIVSSRIFNSPLHQVYRACSEPAHLLKWWGPKGFTNTFQEFDFREGGKWRFIMHGPDKGHYPNECEFIKIDEPRLIAWTRHSKPLFQMVVHFESIAGDQTKLVFRMLFDTAEECNQIKVFAPEKNEENFDRLQEELERMSG